MGRIAAVFVLLFASVVWGADRGRINADRVNLRARPDLQSESIDQLAAGTDVVLIGREGAWFAVEPPPSVSLWVYGELVVDGKSAVDGLQVRSGPGLSYRAVGKVDRGTTLDVRQKKGEWLAIAPPRGCQVWIAAEFVDPIRPEKPAPSKTPVKPAAPAVSPIPVEVSTTAVAPAVSTGDSGSPEPTAAAPLTPATAKPMAALDPGVSAVPSRAVAPQAGRLESGSSLSGKRLVSGVPQGGHAEYEGLFARGRSILFFWRPMRYRILIRDESGMAATRCYVHGPVDKLSPFVGRRVRVTGREYWVQGWRYPSVVAEQVSLVR